MEERKAGGKKYNAYAQLITGRKNHHILNILMDACNWTSPIL